MASPPPPQFTSTSTAEDVAKVYGENARGKVILVTGANSGLGHETARVLAASGAKIVLACRSKANAEKTAQEIREAVPSADLVPLELDLSSLASARRGAEEFLQTGLPLHVLINNAGVMFTPRGTTRDGIETQMGVNHFGHFLFTTLLLDKLKASAPSRVVSVSSNGHLIFQKPGGVDLEDLRLEKNESYDRYNRYAQSKLANILFALELQRRLGPDSGVTAVSLHPGAIPTTNLGRSMGGSLLFDSHTWCWISTMVGSARARNWTNKNIPQGAAPSVFCALAPELAPGEYYFDDCQVAKPEKRHPLSSDAEAAKRLWEATEKIISEVTAAKDDRR